MPNEATPTADHTSRYAPVNSSGRINPRPAIRAYNATVGDTDGNIIAAIITTQAPTNQPRVPRPVPRPASIPAIWLAVDHQARPANTNKRTTSPSRDRAAAKALNFSPGA